MDNGYKFGQIKAGIFLGVGTSTKRLKYELWRMKLNCQSYTFTTLIVSGN